MNINLDTHVNDQWLSELPPVRRFRQLCLPYEPAVTERARVPPSPGPRGGPGPWGLPLLPLRM